MLLDSYPRTLTLVQLRYGRTGATPWGDARYAFYGETGTPAVVFDGSNNCAGSLNGNGIPDECEFCRGDCNCDGDANWRDIDYFVAAMSGEQSWRHMFLPGPPSCQYDNCDVNIDGTVNWRDIDPFVAVMGTACP